MINQPVNLYEYEPLAREKLSAMAYGYFAGGANDEITLRENRAAFERVKLRPRMLRGVADRDLSTTVLGHALPLPLMIAPMGFMAMAHPDGELAVARAAAERGIPMIVSTMGNYPLEEVAAAARAVQPDLPLWFQLYVYKDRGATRALVERAEAAGYDALVFTVDTPILGRREADIRSGFFLPDGLTAANLVYADMGEIGRKIADSGLNAYIASVWESNLSWADVEWLRSFSKLPVLVKGILRGDDAQMAVEYGAAGVIVSNHGGRQLDGAIAGLDALPEVVEAVGGQTTVLVDGGVRRGTDIIKALALGAQAVLLGRPLLWGLAVDGQAGVGHVLDLMRAEFDLAMGLCGCRSVGEVDRGLVR